MSEEERFADMIKRIESEDIENVFKKTIRKKKLKARRKPRHDKNCELCNRIQQMLKECRQNK